MKFISAILLMTLPSVLLASSYVRCSLQASYEIYKGEGMIERSVGSPIVFPVEFGFFTNGTPMTANLSGGYSIINIKAISKDDEATVLLSGGANGRSGFETGFSFHPRNGIEQSLSQSQLSSFNYTSPNNRVVFTKGIVKCLPATNWDFRPVISP